MTDTTRNPPCQRSPKCPWNDFSGEPYCETCRLWAERDTLAKRAAEETERVRHWRDHSNMLTEKLQAIAHEHDQQAIRIRSLEEALRLIHKLADEGSRWESMGRVNVRSIAREELKDALRATPPTPAKADVVEQDGIFVATKSTSVFAPKLPAKRDPTP